MKTIKILPIVILALGLLIWAAQVSEAEPMGNAFTYQGHLYDAKKPANGLYDFQFTLYDDPCDGNQVGSDVNKPDEEVIDGYFTVELDFGSNVFDGNALWLEIGVRLGDLNDPNVYTTLSPRLELTPTPYAIYALSAEDANTVNGYGVGNSSDQAALSNGTVCTNLNADMVDGQHASSFLTSSGDYGRSGVSSTLYEGTTALSGKYLGNTATAVNSDKVDGYNAGNSSGQVAVSNGTVCANLNADKLDGYHGSDFVTPAGMVSNDYGRSGVSSTLYEGTTQLANKYVSLSSSQTIGGTKTFSNQAHFTNGIYVPDPGPSGNAVYVYNNGNSPTIWAKNNGNGTALYGETGHSNAVYGINSSDYYPTIWARNTNSNGSNSIYARNNSSGYPTVYAQQDGSNYAGWFDGDLGCSGSKPATVETQTYGHRNLYSDESAEIYFFDRGQGQLTNGLGVINLDPMFLETVTINDSYPVLVQITLTADCKGVFVSDKTNSNFTVQELQGGASNAAFDWEVAAKRKGYEDTRMEKITFVEESRVETLGTGTENGEEGVSLPSGGVRIIKGE